MKLRFLLCLSAVLLATVAQSQAAALPAESAAPPNILFISVDDLNTRINCYGTEVRAQTPNIDRLAQQGVRFERAYCSVSACNPSRVALLFGLQPTTTGIYEFQWARLSPRLRDAASLPQQLRRHGYKTIGCGKIFHNLGRDSFWVDRDSWDEYAPIYELPRRRAEPAHGFEPGELGAHWFDWGTPTYPGTTDETMWEFKNAHWIDSVLKREHKKPFFLAFGTSAPHLPFYVPQKYFDMYPLDKVPLPEVLENDLEDLPAAARDMAWNDLFRPGIDPGRQRSFHRELVAKGKWREAVRGYLAATTYADAAIGVVLDALARSPYANNTIVVLWGDNGWHLGEKGHWQKCTVWNEGSRVPLIIAAPGAPRGAVCSRPVSLLDLYPTLTELCGIPAPAGLEGHSLTPLLKNPSADWPHPALSFYRRGMQADAVRKGNWTLIHYGDGSNELYNAAEDPREWHNLANDPAHAPVIEELLRCLPTTNAPRIRGLSKAEEEAMEQQHRQHPWTDAQ